MFSSKCGLSAQQALRCVDFPNSEQAAVEQRGDEILSSNVEDFSALTPPASKSCDPQLTQEKGDTRPQESAPVSVDTKDSIQSSDTTPAISLKLFVENLSESTRLIRDNIESFLRNEKIGLTRKVATVGGVAAAVAACGFHGLSDGLGALGLVMCYLGSRLKENRHMKAQGVAQGGLLASHFAAAHNDAMTFTNGTWAGRMLLHSMIPESREGLNLAVAAVGTALSCAMFCCSSQFSPGLTFENIPLVAIVVGAAGNSLPSNRSWLARIGYLTGSCLMLPYHCAISGSLFLATLAVTSGHGHAKTLLEEDLPRLRKSIKQHGFVNGVRLCKSDTKKSSTPEAEAAKKSNPS